MRVRIIWAIIIIATVLPIIFFVNNLIFTIIVTLVALIAMRELLKAAKRTTTIVSLFIYLFVIFTCMYSYFLGMLDNYYFIILFIVITVLLVLRQDLNRFNFNDASVIFMLTMYVILSFNALINIKVNYDLHLFFYPVIIAVLADTFGYFGGSLFGKRKLIPTISPKKTIEGAISATIFASIYSIIYLYMVGYSIPTLLIITIIMVVLSQIGDLVASAIKRTYNIKDYSNLIPGHGGVMDRLDSILFNFIVLSVILVYV